MNYLSIMNYNIDHILLILRNDFEI